MDMRDKTIKALEKAIQCFERYSGDEYGREYNYAHIEVESLENALALLKEYERAIKFQSDRLDALLKAQELVEPTLRGGIGGYWYCGACNYQISRGDKFCRYCGQEVKWE